ncbi:K02A2.6-like [Cordylochernes scorpioides]|uniref:RNA-directed DNA polymerase n=1 Tax=Cordylochernes scorpioides TaxID=51811 RepID=A0ABY6JWN9_9ARAC|nr:K02A2.6-like [Cordylochernes scorpioides]
MASYQFKEYNEETETFETFYERLEQFLILEEAGDEKKKAYLLTLMGSKTYGVLKNLCSPILPKDKTFDNLINILKRHFSPKRSIVVERFIFFKRMQLKEESISDYLVEIKRLASSCNFGNFLEDSLRDKMVCGLYNAKIQNRILSEGDISLAKVIEIALSMEAAEKNTKLFHLEQGEDCVDKLRMERKVESNFQNGKCKHCGKQHKELCRFKEAICFKCNKKGHIASICWSSRRNLRQHQNQPGNIHQIGDQEEEEEYVQKIISVTIPEYKINFASSDPPYLMELKVEGNFIKFEMDTGSGLTLISEKDFKNSLQHLKLEKASIIVRTYDGTVVPILGKINVKVECQDITYKLRALVVKGEKRALMGREWINRLKLGCFAVKHMPVEITIEEILKENQALFVETTEPIKGFTFSVNMCDVNPIFHKARPVPFAIRPAVTEALDKMVAKGYLCEVASSKWATPVVVVPKKNKEIRICCDFKVTLNKYLDTAAYPLPTQQDLFSTLAKGKYFSKLDLRNAYLQLEVDPGTRPLLTINTHKGLFRFKRMPFGLANAPSYFQSVMDRVLSGIGGVICYIDDVLIATASIEEHLALLKTIFARLAKYNIKLKKEKCLFLQKEIEYLGHLVTEEGIRPLDHKVQAIQKAKTPTNISELRSFLGLVNFYGKFIPNLPELLKPLHELLHKKRPWVWTKECGEAIDKCKNSITSERVLVPYDATLPLCLATDASQIGVGAVLSHIIEGQERPIMFASRTLSEAEQNYSQIEKEALAIIYGVTKFHQFIYGRKFILITDHKPLVTILGSRSGIPTLSTSRLQRWALILSAYTYDIKFRRTQDHGNADLLSRFPVGCEEIPRLNNVYALSYVEELPITAEEIATETEKDEVLSLAKFYTQQGWPEKVADHLRPYFQRKLELTVDGECLVWGMRVVIPPSLRIKMLNCLHETHSGMNKMKAVARSHFWWPNLDTQIEFLVNKCRSCQQSQDGPNKGKWQPWRWSTRPWQRIHIDFANKENINLLIVVDSHSKWIEAIPMRETTTRKTIEQLRRLFSSYGLPEELVSDNGPQFTGSEMKGFLEGNGIKQTLIPAYHPQSNGLAERAVRTIKTALDKNERKIGDTIQDTLSKVLLAYRSTPHVTTGKTPSELFIGRALRTRVSLIHPSLTSRVRDQQARQMKYDQRTQLEEFQIDDLVWCKNFRGGDKWIPGKIVGKKGTRVYTILIHGQVKAYHRDQIRKRWRNGEEDESGDGERQPEHSSGAGPSAIISEVVRDRGYMESLSPGLTSQRSDQDSEVQSDTDDGKSLEPLRSLDPEALKEEGPVLRRNPPRARRPPRQRDPSTFSGDGNINPGQWLKEYERVSKYNRWDETMKLANVVFYLNGTAGRWFDNNEESLNSWRSFEDAFRGVFGRQEDSARRAEEVLKSRAQKAEESSESFIQEILSLCHQVNPRMEEDDLAALIRRIVREEIQKVFSAPEVINPLREVNALEQTVREEVSRALQPTRPQVNVVQQQPRTPYYNIDRPTQPRKTEHWRTYDDIPICFHCRRPGHVVRYCRERRQVFAEARSRNGGEGRNVGFSSRPPRYDADDDYVTPQTSTYFYRSSSPHPSRAGHDIIFGWDFFKATEAVIDCGRNELHLGETSVLEYREEENQRLFASDDFVIPPKSIKKISVINEEICGVRDVLVSTSKDLLLRKEVLIPNSLVTYRHGRGSIWVANGASWPQLIPSGMNMCTMESYENGNICSLIESSDKLQETQLKSREWSQKIPFSRSRLSEIQRLQLVSCLDEFIGIFDFGSTPIKPTSTVKHKINTGDQSPIKQRPYRVAPSERRLIQDEVNKMIENHIVKPSESPWSSPVILVRKKDGTWRYCVDYRRLNKITKKKDVYPLPRIDDALDSLAGSSYFSTMDLRSGYWQIEVDEKDREKTAFITPDGLYEFQVMPFGLCNAPATFERIIDSVLGSLKWNMCLCYLDDIVVYAPTFEEHLLRLQLVLSCIQKAGLSLNHKKCLFGSRRIKILGHLVDANGIHPDPDKVEAVSKFPRPRNISELKSFLGICSYYRRFIENFADKARSLHDLLKTEKQFYWDAAQEKAFEVLKTALISEPVLGHFDESADTHLHTDASGHGQKDPSGRLARWALKLQEFDVTVIYKSGRKHKDADCLSRSPLENDQPSAVMSLTNVDIEQTKDPVLAKIIDNLNSGYTRKEFSIIDGIIYKKNYSTTGRPWLMMIPKHLRSEVMADLHDAPTAGHLGFARTYDKVKKRFYWPGLYRTVRQYVSHCRECQRRKKLPRRPAGQLVSIPPVEKPFYKVGVDLFGRFPVSKDGNRWIIVCTDYMTRYAITKAIPDGGTIETAKFLVEDVILKHGAPREMITDRGRNFISQVIKEINALCGIVHRFTTAYHPQTNGLTERFNKTLGDMLSMYTGVEQKDWDQVLPYVTFAYNTAKQEATGYIPFFLVHAREAETYIDAVPPYLPDEISDDYVGELVTRAEEARQLSRSRLLQSQAKDRRLYDQKHTPVYYQKDDFVWVFTPIRKVGLSEKLLKRYFGPYKVTKKLSEVMYEVEPVDPSPRSRKAKDIVHVIRMKPYLDPEEQHSILLGNTSRDRFPSRARAETS